MKILLAAILLATSSLPAQDPEDLQHFEYDRAAALDIKETGVAHRGKVSIHDISYASPKGGRVPAFLVVPDGEGPVRGGPLRTLVLGELGIPQPQGVPGGSYRVGSRRGGLPAHRRSGGPPRPQNE